MTAEERAEKLFQHIHGGNDPGLKWWIDAFRDALQAHAHEAVEAERETSERLVAACKEAMTAMREITAHERKQGGATYDYFDDEIAACEAALERAADE